MTTSITTIGQGRDLVLIHGWAMHDGIFAPLVDLLSPHFRLHLVDLPGHGNNRAYAPGSLDPLVVARSIANVTPTAIWIGWSLGGLVALRAALDVPSQVQGLVEIASSPRFVIADDWPHAVPASVFRDFGAGLEAAFHSSIERFLALETLGSPNAQEELRRLKLQVFERGEPAAQALHEGLAILDTADLRRELQQLKMPSLWIAGRRDRLIPPAAMRWAAEHSPQGQFLELSAGHAPFISHTIAVADAIVAFADSVSPQ
jgi:pimeloyl-[acyl-carrier protein] methyl ester esterase